MEAPSKGFSALQKQLDHFNSVEVANAAATADEENVPFKKMPVSFLQELCGRKQVVCIYSLRASEGQSHDPIFVMGVEVDDLSGYGRAKNKKVAKHIAARDVLYRIVENDRYQEWQIQGNTREEAYQFLRDNLADVDVLPGAVVDRNVMISVPADGAADPAPEGPQDASLPNPISKLVELCGQRLWPAPQFDTVEESGMPHDKTFVIKVMLGLHERTGTAKTKKLAKRLAAEAMLKFLDEMPLEEHDKELRIEPEEPEEEGDEKMINSDTNQNVIHLINIDQPPSTTVDPVVLPAENNENFEFRMNGFGNVLPLVSESKNETLTPNQEKQQTTDPPAKPEPPAEPKPPFWDELQSMDTDAAAPCQYHKDFLKRVAEHNKWQVSYDSLQKKSKLGQFMSLASISGNKHACHGSGDTKEEAECSAALSLLDLLKMGD